MALTDRAESTRLILQLERDLSAEAQLRTLLAAAETSTAGRQALRAVKARREAQRVNRVRAPC